MDLGCLFIWTYLKVRLTSFASRFDMECEGGRRDKDASKVFCSEYQEKGVAIY